MIIIMINRNCGYAQILYNMASGAASLQSHIFHFSTICIQICFGLCKDTAKATILMIG